MSSDREDQNLFSESSNIMDNVYKYPEGLRILAVDDNPVCLKLLSAVLKKCRYQFTATTEASEAYEILKKNRNSYDLVLTDVKNNMDEFKFAQLIDLEMDIPVIIMSADDGKESVMNGIKHGARNYLLKPVRYEELKIIWQHVARKNHFQLEKKSLENAITNPNPIPLRQIDDDNEQEEETKAIVISEIKKTKKQRFSWKPDVHAKFVNAVDQLGVENAVPKKILQLMNEPNLSRENVASHLQKYRKHSDEQKKKAKTDLSSMGMDRDIGGNYQNGLEQPVIDNNDLISYGTNIRAICNNVKSQEGISQNQLQFLGTGDKISHTIRNNEVDSNWNQNFGQTQGVNGMRFNSFCSKPTRMENNYYYNGYSSPSVRPSNSLLMLPSNSSYGPIRSQSNNMARHADSLPMLPLSSSYDEIQMPDASRSIQMVQPTYSLPMLPSSSFGQNQMLDATHLTHMGQRTNSLPMLPSSSSYGQIQMNNANHSIQKAQSTNSLPMLATSSTYGQLERGDSFVFNGKEETNSFLFDTREQNIECLPWDPIDIGCDFDDIGDLFNDNSAPSLG